MSKLYSHLCTSVAHSSAKFPRVSVKLESIDCDAVVGQEIRREHSTLAISHLVKKVIEVSAAKEAERREGEIGFILTNKNTKANTSKMQMEFPPWRYMTTRDEYHLTICSGRNPATA
jgi:hypothetical protein